MILLDFVLFKVSKKNNFRVWHVHVLWVYYSFPPLVVLCYDLKSCLTWQYKQYTVAIMVSRGFACTLTHWLRKILLCKAISFNAQKQATQCTLCKASCFSWYRNNFNLLLYGLGSKRTVVNQFRREMLKDAVQVVVNGFFPSLTIKNVSSNRYICLSLFKKHEVKINSN